MRSYRARYDAVRVDPQPADGSCYVERSRRATSRAERRGARGGAHEPAHRFRHVPGVPRRPGARSARGRAPDKTRRDRRSQRRGEHPSTASHSHRAASPGSPQHLQTSSVRSLGRACFRRCGTRRISSARSTTRFCAIASFPSCAPCRLECTRSRFAFRRKRLKEHTVICGSANRTGVVANGRDSSDGAFVSTGHAISSRSIIRNPWRKT